MSNTCLIYIVHRGDEAEKEVTSPLELPELQVRIPDVGDDAPPLDRRR